MRLLTRFNNPSVVPYQEPNTKGDSPEFGSTLSSTMPMAAMFTRNKFVGWAGVVFSIQNWLGESAETKKNGTPGYFNVGLSGTSKSLQRTMCRQHSYPNLVLQSWRLGSHTCLSSCHLPFGPLPVQQRLLEHCDILELIYVRKTLGGLNDVGHECGWDEYA